MRKLVLGLGLLILLIGLILIASSDISEATTQLETLESVDNTQETQRTYRVTHNLTQGQKMVVDFLPPVDWYVSFPYAEPATDTEPALAHIWVNISDTVSESNGTWFEVSFAKGPNNKPYLYNISMFEFGNNLIVEDSPRFVGGIVLFSDAYTAEVIPIPNSGPPSTITLFLEIPIVEKPYAYLLPTGAVVSGLGIPPFILSFKKQRKKHSVTRNSKT
jgi:hypothetical protein